MSVNPHDAERGEKAEKEPGSSAASRQQEQETVTEASVRVQRSPRYSRFMLIGAILFAVAALLLTFAFPANPIYDRSAVFGFLLALGVTVGVALGAAVALLADRLATRRARTVRADRIDVHIVEAPDGSRPIDDSRPTSDS